MFSGLRICACVINSVTTTRNVSLELLMILGMNSIENFLHEVLVQVMVSDIGEHIR